MTAKWNPKTYRKSALRITNGRDLTSEEMAALRAGEVIPVVGENKSLLMDSYDQIRVQTNKEKQTNDMNKKSRCETVFAEELALIRDRDLRSWVVETFAAVCPDAFWTQSASTTHKYHPRVSVGEGGLVRHTKLAVWWGLELAKALELERLNDETVAALLLHDVLKREDNVGTHGLEMAFMMGIKYPAVRDAVARHMGRWTTGGWYRTEFTLLVHLADYCASRKVDAKLEELENERA